MQLGMIGLGRMGANMARRLLGDGHEVVAFDLQPEAVAKLVDEGTIGVSSLAELVGRLVAPRVVWLMLPAASVDRQVDLLATLLQPGDTLVDGGNTNFRDDLQRERRLRAMGINYVDVGVSGGVWGLERGYCLMIGGSPATVGHLEPLFVTLAPGRAVARSDGRPAAGSAESGYLHCGPVGAGHFVKMVHNGIEYGLMAAYAEGFNILRQAGFGTPGNETDQGSGLPLGPGDYRYQLPLGEIAELWRHGSVIGSWLLDLLADALAENPSLSGFDGRVADSGEGRWAAIAAIEQGAPALVLTAALFGRFASRGQDDFANQVLSALRAKFGGHRES
jgi:6-phosphogluconate dehydrogenase